MIGKGLSLEQSPPLHCSFRFFITAPILIILATVLFLITDNHFPRSHHQEHAVTLTHFFTLGFILMIMIGALFQLLPVLAGVIYKHPVQLANIVHTGLVLAIIGFLSGLLGRQAELVQYSTGLLLLILYYFILVSLWGLFHVEVSTPTIIGLRYALFSLLFTVTAGWLLAFRYIGWPMVANYFALFTIHLLWAFAGWIGILLITIGFQVIPMFFVTPEYPQIVKKYFAHILFWLLVLNTICLSFFQKNNWWTLASFGLTILIFLFYASLAIFTITLFIKRRRKLPDTSNLFWRFGLALIPFTLFIFILAETLESSQLKLLFGILLIGSIVSIILAMIYKIIPFLIWFNLFSKGIMNTPNMKQIISERNIKISFILHIFTLFTFIVSNIWQAYYPLSLITLLISMSWLLTNMLNAIRIYRNNLQAL